MGNKQIIILIKNNIQVVDIAAELSVSDVRIYGLMEKLEKKWEEFEK